MEKCGEDRAMMTVQMRSRKDAICMPDSQGFRHTLRIFNTFCFTAWTHLNTTLYAYWLSCIPLILCLLLVHYSPVPSTITSLPQYVNV